MASRKSVVIHVIFIYRSAQIFKYRLTVSWSKLLRTKMVMTASDNVRGREGKNQSQENWEKSTRSFSNVKNHLEGVVLGSSRD